MARIVVVLVLVVAILAPACSSGARESWRQSGRSWREGGQQFFRAIGRSISGDGSPKQEWKRTGKEFREAGSDTADALGESVKPPAGSGSDDEPKRR